MKKKNRPEFSVANRHCFDLLELSYLSCLFGCTLNFVLEALAFYFCGVLTMKGSKKKEQCFKVFNWDTLWLNFVPVISVVKLNACNFVFLV